MSRRRGCLLVFAAAYGLLLLLSHLWRWQHPWRQAEPPAAVHVLAMPELDAEGQATGRSIDLAYWEWVPADGEPKSTLLLLHGSPGGGDFVGMGPLLAERGYRAIAPDLPGFGFSSRRIADYSFRDHALYCDALLRALAIPQVDVVGYSMGGGVALHLIEDDPGRVRSLALLSAIGVQELELLGIYELNHAVHYAQWLGLLALYEAVPHFGAFDGGMLSVEYGLNFLESDQRPLRAMLRRLELPVLILHGRNDMLVPYAVAEEHHRLVPHSELVTFDADHFMVYEEPAALVAPLASWLDRLAAGEAPRRAQATPERLAAAEELMVFRQPPAKGPTLLIFILLLALATLVSEDLTCIAAGLLVARGMLGFVPAAFACAAGIFVGDLLLYGLGRFGGGAIESGLLRRWITPEDVARHRRAFDRRAGWVIFASRFLPGTRLPIYVTAGVLGMGFWRFAFFLLVPVALWTPLLVGLSALLGERFFAAFQGYERYALWASIGFLLSLWLLLALLRAVGTWRGRRGLVGFCQRWRHWEFWPPWAFYPPVVAYLAILAWRHRSATLFTAANPGMAGGGGFVGESKSEILAGLDPAAVAPWRLLPAGDAFTRREAVSAFQREMGVDYPVVLKPDVGQRGSGVVVARDAEAIDAFLAATPGPAIVQRFVDGPELGVFYVRLPEEPTGRIFSITHKQLPDVVGDGVATLERLILDDARAVAMAPTYLARFAARRDEVPAPGERVRLVELGTHCRGAVFVDGWQYRTPELEAAVDAIARSFPGFYFGRFDLRAPSFEHFRRGEGIQVLELNGVTSEATHIYDRRNSVLTAWRVLFEQWRLAYAIGAQNRDRGFAPATVGELWRLVREFRASQRSGQRAGASAPSSSSASR